MPIINLQRRLREAGRIRLGQQVTTTHGKRRPAKLETFRFSSRDPRILEEIATRWGGTVGEWPDAPGGPQWQVFTDTSEIPVVVPPTDMAFSQWFELWSAGGCQQRCDGRWDMLNDQACSCNPDARKCAMHTRLSVLLPDLPGIGLWRLDTSSYYAATELAGIVELCQRYMTSGIMLPARLRLEQRSVKRKNAGGGVETRNFAVPVLDVDVNPLALTADPVSIELPTTANLTPIPPATATAPSVAEQLTQTPTPRRAPRANAAAPLPSTGLAPRTAAQIGPGDTSLHEDEEKEAVQNSPDGSNTAVSPGLSLQHLTPPQRVRAVLRARELASRYRLTPPNSFDEITNPKLIASVLTALQLDDERPADTPVEHRGVTITDVAKLTNTVFADEYAAAPRGHKSSTINRLRHAIVYAATNGQTASSKTCTPEQLAATYRVLKDIQDGRLTYVVHPTHLYLTYQNSKQPPVVIPWTSLQDDDD